MRASTRFFAALALTGTLWSSALADDEEGWRKIRDEQGIAVSTREQAGSDFPEFRGHGVVRGPVLHVLALVLDDARASEWAKGSKDARVLRKMDARTELVYSRSPQPWPVRDRDLVMQRTIEVIKPGEIYRVRLVCVPSEEPEHDAVRIKQCETQFVLRKVDERSTTVDFRVRVDPGGGSPAWLAGWASKSVPFETLLGLRKQVEKTRGQYDAAIRVWEHAS